MADYFVMKNASLKRYNTMRLDVTADTVIIPHTVDGLVEALRDHTGKRIVLVGNGSNMIFSQEHYDDNTVFIITILLNDLEIVDNEIVAESGVRLNRLAWFACEQSLGDMEFCEDIPGTVGGALIMNAGQWQYAIGQFVNWIEVFNYETQEVERLIPDEAFFGYRYSRLNDLPVYVLRSGLKTIEGDYNQALEKMLYYRHERYVKQPRNYANAGSVFKRPKDKNGESLFVWKLFDGVDLRGFRVGDAMVSEKHPGFIVNVGHASVEDVQAVIQECKKRVKDEYDVELELEWRVI
ncbi:UDP-N-acetylmuramate dehydrogenase [Erysipelothrix piscisicarius]|uniref:UDP-N-acetylenolpyruvoylglucosamine reductase n=1 Tax=Erysipelothrix piscisicarius TaxID=2485784 RepID=A0A3S8RNT3_9FIRM|nr:UDP-N-acetylmuramate dehydrogenase [Erysipelothrix piscisicarius]AZK44539.1 UDP-N-acetylmuramate dehydrogenase [Erysipelothrix piscisicarius]